MATESFAFGGWVTPNFTMIPDQFFDEVMPHLSEAELRVLLYIMRRTFGFKKAQDNISLAQMVDGITAHDGQVLDQGCGLSKSAVAKGLKLLSGKRIITATRNQSRDKGNLPTTYSLYYAGDMGAPPPLSTWWTHKRQYYKKQRDKGNSKIRMTSPVDNLWITR